ncbi:MAG: RtcB family protein, partial [Desulfobacteraceae bacterium]|nr:RtcB family protein [Desulfobacteraceae bacterium]
MNITSVGYVPKEYLNNSICKNIADCQGVNQIVLLPDVHIKKKYLNAGYQCAIPSSCVISSDKKYLYPQFRSRGIGCGMALWPMGIHIDEITSSNLSTFFLSFFEHLIKPPTIMAQGDELLGRFIPNLPNISSSPLSYGMKRSKWLSIILGGAEKYIKDNTFENTNIITNFESAGNHLNSEDIDCLKKNKEIFSNYLYQGRDFSGGDYQAGLWVTGNHFIEIQKVSKLYNIEKAKKAGLIEGSLVIMNHSCGAGLEWALHNKIVARYIRTTDFNKISPSNNEYTYIQLVIGFLKNLGSLRRAIFYKRCVDNSNKHIKNSKISLLAECNHNDIEWVDNQIIYRHNAIKLNTGRFQIISGANNHPSYLIEPGKKANASYFSVGHGIGAYLQECVYKP